MTVQTERTLSQPALEVERHIEALLTEFDRWAASADRQDDGWESDFPQWQELMQQAEQIMAQKQPSEQALFLLSRCWSLSEEDEDCADWAREHIDDRHVRSIIFRLTASPDPNTQWQAYDALNDLQILDGETQDVLEAGTKNASPYVRRRAFLVLFNHSKVDVQPYIEQMLMDADAYNRYVAVTEGKRLMGAVLQDQMQTALQDPEVAFLFSLVDLPQPDKSLAFISYYENKKPIPPGNCL